MMKRISMLTSFCLAVIVIAASAATADDTFEYKGYMRIGTQLNASGNAPDAWGIRGAQKWSGRLGNEDQARPYQDPFFLEQSFVKNWTSDNGSFAKCVVLMNYYGKPVGDNGDQIGVSENSSTTKTTGNTALRLRQAYVEMGGFGSAPNTTFWIGKRFLNRKDVYVLDWYFLDFSGNGCGVTNIANLGVDLAYIQRLADTDANNTSEGNGRRTSNNIVAKFENSAFRFDANVNFVTNGVDKNNKKTLYSSQFASAQYKPEKFFSLLPGSSSLTAQYANGVQANCCWNGNRNTNNLEEGWCYNVDAKATYLMAMATGDASITDTFTVNPVLVYRYMDLDRTKSDNNPDAKWKAHHIVTAMRSTYSFNPNFAACLELGCTMAKVDCLTYGGTPSFTGMRNTKKDRWSAVYKVTPSLLITPDAGYWSRPQLRVGYVYTAGTKDYQTSGTGTNTGEASAQWFFVQAEAWW